MEKGGVMAEPLPLIKRERWWVLNEGVLLDLFERCFRGESPESAITWLLVDSTVERYDPTVEGDK